MFSSSLLLCSVSFKTEKVAPLMVAAEASSSFVSQKKDAAGRFATDDHVCQRDETNFLRLQYI